MKYHALKAVLLLSFILGSYKGYLALYDKGAAEPRQIYPCEIALLPQADQEALEKGIPVRDREKLATLLEDYLS